MASDLHSSFLFVLQGLENGEWISIDRLQTDPSVQFTISKGETTVQKVNLVQLKMAETILFKGSDQIISLKTKFIHTSWLRLVNPIQWPKNQVALD